MNGTPVALSFFILTALCVGLGAADEPEPDA